MNDLPKCMNLLLNNFWITKDDSLDDYYFLKRNQNIIRNFVSKNLGSRLIVHDRFIKLEKIPSLPHFSYGITSFISVYDYVILFLILFYLEDKPKGEKFIISQITEYIKNTAITLKLSHIPDWNLRSHRNSLIRVLDYLQSISVVKLRDEDEQSFSDNNMADALYEVTGISNYVLPSFDYDIYELQNPSDFLECQWGEQSTDRGDIRRYKVYRHLLFSPVTFRMDISDSIDDYLRKMHKVIHKELLDNLEMEVQITKNMAFVYVEESTIQKEYFPNTKNVSDIVLLVNSELIKFIVDKKIEKSFMETYFINKDDMYEIFNNLRFEKKKFFSKKILDLAPSKYYSMILNYMEEFHFIRETHDGFIIFPIVFRFVGKVSNDSLDLNNQLEMFGGDFDEI